jgi:hypothetical protein
MPYIAIAMGFLAMTQFLPPIRESAEAPPILSS